MNERYILVVDDDKDFRDLITDYLEEQGFRTIEAGDGDVALKHIEQNKPDLILLDNILSAGSGLDVCRTLKAQPSTTGIPIIIITGRTSLSDRLAGYLAGANRYLCKPFELGELGECVRNVLHHHGVRE